MDSFATLGGEAVKLGRVLVSWGGPWIARAVLDAPTLPEPDPFGAELVIAGVVFRGSMLVDESGEVVETGSACVLGGAAGWRRPIDALGYTNDGGVLASTVIRDAAELVGERFEIVAGVDPQSPTARELNLGRGFFHFGRRPAAEVVERIAPGRWWVGPDGTTRIGARPRPFTKAGTYEVLRWWPLSRRAELVVESPLTLVPGAVLLPEGPLTVPRTIGAVEFVISPRRFRAFVTLGAPL